MIFVLLYPAAGIVYLIFAGRGLSVRVKQLSDYGEKEQQMKVSIQVCRESSFWIGKCRVLLEMEHAVSCIRQKDSLWLSEKQADYTFEPDRCGEWKLTITEVRIYDFMGILSVGKKQQEKQRFTVLPKICAMPVEIGRRTREFPVEPETYSNERGGQDATEIYQIREYHIPDPVQMIHWKISAKAGKMMVKESSHPLGCAVCIRLWLSDAAKDFKKLERMIEICASLSRTLVEEHCMHVVAWFDQKNVRVVRWRVKDEETFYEMLWELMEAVPAAKREEEQKEESEKEEQKAQAEIPQTEQNMIPEETGMDSSGGMEDLRELGSFVPRKGVLFTVTQEEMPTDTIYVSEKYGKEYDGGSWSEGSATDPASVYLQYPSSLKQLRKLCSELQEADSFEEAERFVEETLKRQAVYDVNPGSTPSGEDFAEYFLFENHRGFCVHFATAATLMYRMRGIPARFVEGYAIPASAFSQQENGQYVAEVEGSMGHAWCEVWQEDTGWKVEDHTGAASALENVESERASSDTWQQIRKAIFQCLKVIGVILLVFALIILQAWIRTVRKRKRCRTGSIDVRVRFVYQSLYEVAEFLHPSGEDPFSMQGKEAVKKSLPELEETDLNWMYDTMMRTMFYKGCDIRDGEQMYRLYGQCRKKVKQGLNAWKKLQWNVIKCFP